jgi:hypothetical protein
MIVRTHATPARAGAHLDHAVIRDAEQTVRRQLGTEIQNRGLARGHARCVWEVRDRDDTRRVWDPWTIVPADTVEATCIGIWRADYETITGREAS